MREVRDPGGLTCLNVGGREYVAIVDSGNHRVVIWSDTTAYVAAYEDPAFTPMAMAVDSENPSVFGVVGRTKAGVASVRRLTFDGSAVALAGYTSLSDASVSKDGALGIAIAKAPAGSYRVAISDGAGKKVLEYLVTGNNLVLASTMTAAIGVCAGDPTLENPLDVVYVRNDGALQLFALDGGDRLIRLQ